MTQKPTGAVKVVVTSVDSGEVLADRVIDNDYAVITAGRCYLSDAQTYRRKHVLTVVTVPATETHDDH